MKKKEKKLYFNSQLILTLITFVTINILFFKSITSKGGLSLELIPILYSLLVFAFSYLGSIIVKFLIETANKIEDKIMRIIYYVIPLPIGVGILCFINAKVISFILKIIPTKNEIGSLMNEAIWEVLIIMALASCIISIYIQTLIVLILKHQKN